MTEKKQLSEKQIHEIIELAWCDKTSFEKMVSNMVSNDIDLLS